MEVLHVGRRRVAGAFSKLKRWNEKLRCFEARTLEGVIAIVLVGVLVHMWWLNIFRKIVRHVEGS